jgi:hypothetical protein
MHDAAAFPVMCARGVEIFLLIWAASKASKASKTL